MAIVSEVLRMGGDAMSGPPRSSFGVARVLMRFLAPLRLPVRERNVSHRKEALAKHAFVAALCRTSELVLTIAN
jgi:hypothetical protein